MSVRMQIYLSKEQYELLKQKSKQTGQPMAAYIRESLSKYLAETDRTQVYSDDPIWEITGKTSSASDELSTRHDYFLYEQDDGGEN